MRNNIIARARAMMCTRSIYDTNDELLRISAGGSYMHRMRRYIYMAVLALLLAHNMLCIMTQAPTYTTLQLACSIMLLLAS